MLPYLGEINFDVMRIVTSLPSFVSPWKNVCGHPWKLLVLDFYQSRLLRDFFYSSKRSDYHFFYVCISVYANITL